MVIVVLLAVLMLYALCLVPLGFALRRSLKALSTETRSREVYEGIAFSCIIAVLAALFLTRGLEPQPSILGWLGFVVACGLSLWLPDPPRFKDVMVCAVAPALALLATLIAIFLIPYCLSGMFGPMMSTVQPVKVPPFYPIRALLFTLFVSLVSIPAIAVAVYARRRVLTLGKLAVGDSSKALGNVEKMINTLTRIATTVAAIFVVLR